MASQDAGRTDPEVEDSLDVKGGALKFDPPRWVMDKRYGQSRRDAIARTLCDMIDADRDLKNQRGGGSTDEDDDDDVISLEAEWNDIDDLYLGRTIESIEPPYEGAPTYNLNTLRNKVDGVVSFTINPLFKNMPNFLLREHGPDGKKSDMVQTWVHYFFAGGNWNHKAKQTGKLICRRGRALVKPEYVESYLKNGVIQAPKIVFRPLDIRFAIAYPNNESEIEEMRCIGYRYNKRAQWVAEQQRKGEFFSDYKMRQASEGNYTMGSASRDKQTAATNSRVRADDPIDFAWVYAKFDLDRDGIEEWYLCQVSVMQQALMRIELVKECRIRLANFFFDEELNRFYPEGCLGNLLHDVHNWVNDMANLTVWGGLYDSMRPMFGDALGLPGEDLEVKPGRFYATEMGGQVYSPQSQASTGVFPELVNLAKDTANETSRISQNGMGANLKSSTTATEADQIAMGQATGIEDFAQGFAMGSKELCRLVMDLLAENFADWTQYYRSQGVEIKLTKQDFEKDYWIEINGTTPMNTPSAIINQIGQMLTGLQPLLAVDPSLLQAMPQLPFLLLKQMVVATQFPNKDELLQALDKVMGINQAASEGAVPGAGDIANETSGGADQAAGGVDGILQQLAGVGVGGGLSTAAPGAAAAGL
jgi:hypothetical protein